MCPEPSSNMESYIYIYIQTLNTVIMVSFCFSQKERSTTIPNLPSNLSATPWDLFICNPGGATIRYASIDSWCQTPCSWYLSRAGFWELPTKNDGIHPGKTPGKEIYRFNDGHFLLTGVCLTLCCCCCFFFFFVCLDDGCLMEEKGREKIGRS